VAPREKQPFIAKGDDVTIRRSGAISGIWRVAAARYANDNPEDARIEMVLSRGSAMTFKTLYDPKTMTVKSNTPPHILSRDTRVGKPVGDVRRKSGGGRRP